MQKISRTECAKFYLAIIKNLFSNTWVGGPVTEPTFEKIVYEARTKFIKADKDFRFISSVYIRPRMKVVQKFSEIEIRQQPQEKIVYKTGVTLFVSI